MAIRTCLACPSAADGNAAVTNWKKAMAVVAADMLLRAVSAKFSTIYRKTRA